MQIISQHAAFSSWLPWPTFSEVPLAAGGAPVQRRKSTISSFPVLIVVLAILFTFRHWSADFWLFKASLFSMLSMSHQLSVSTIDLLRIANFLQTQTERHSFSSAGSKGCKMAAMYISELAISHLLCRFEILMLKRNPPGSVWILGPSCCMCIYVHIYTNTHAHTHIYICTHTYACIYL